LRRTAWVAAVALALAGAAFAPPAVAPFVARADDAPPADPVAEATRLANEAKEYERVAGDADADPVERKAARKNARERLKKARDLLDAYLDGHPSESEKYDALYSDIQIRYYWVKKMSSVDEAAGDEPSNGAGAPPPAATPPAATPPAPGTAQPPKPPEPPTPAKALAEIEEYRARHKADVPGLYERYQDFLAKYPDPSAPEYATAMAQVAELSKRLKDVYRLVHDDDPDSIRNVDSAQTEKLLGQLLDDLDKGSPEVRERAAKFLGALGSGKAADPLVKAMRKEKSGPVFDACADSLARIGGRRVCEGLLKSGDDDQLAPKIVEILEKILARGGAEGRVAGEALGGFAGAVKPADRGPIFEALAAAGPAGALGLASGLEFSPPEQTAALIAKLADAGEPRVVTYLAPYLVAGAQGDRGVYAHAARDTIRKIGKPGVRYLIPHLDEPALSVWTAKLLQDITGQRLKDDKRKTWEAWFRMNRKALEGK
jgi:hypothetical protein